MIETFTGKGTKERTYRFAIPASAVRRGQKVKVTIAVERAGHPGTPVTLVARRI